HAAVDGAGKVWVAYQNWYYPVNHVQMFRLDPVTNAQDQTSVNDLANPDLTPSTPFVLPAAGLVWVFWAISDPATFSSGYIQVAVWSPSTGWSTPAQVPYTAITDSNPVAALDASNGIALAFGRLNVN